MSGWIKLWKDMPEDPRVLAAAAELAKRYAPDVPPAESIPLYRNAVTGALVTLWCYADEYIRDDDTLPLTLQTLDAVVGIEDFFSLMPREWIDKLDNGCIILCGYCEKNALVARRERTIKSNARVTRWRRANQRQRNAVTSEHTTHGNGAGDIDQHPNKDKEQEKSVSSATAVATIGNVSREPDPLTAEWWLDFKLAYPPRSGDQGWRRATRAAHARLAEGHTAQQLLDGAIRYRAYCDVLGKTGGEYVKQACSFLGPDKHFLEPWAPPLNKAEVRQSRNISAAEQWLQNQESKDATR